VDLDATDQTILQVLQEDGRITNVDLADKVHLSPSAVLRRVRRLEESGVIRGYTAVLDKAAIGVPTSVHVEIGLTSQHEEVLDAFEDAVRDIPEVMSCYLMAGAADYLVHVVCADVADYERIHRSQIAQLPGVANLRSNFAIRTVVERSGYQMT
jgi:Lrp/AsnC family leucine-responsive transcriptional regulator